MDEDAVVDSVGFLGEALNLGLTQTILDTILSTDVCPVLNDDLIDDLIVLERLNDPAVGNLVRSSTACLMRCTKRGAQSATRDGRSHVGPTLRTCCHRSRRA